MRTLLARCTACGAGVGLFDNQWQRATVPLSYLCPALEGAAPPRLTGVTRARGRCMGAPAYDHRALAGSVIDGCQIRDIRCSRCRRSLGFAVVAASQEKSQYRDREFFREASLEFVDERSGEPAQLLYIDDLGDQVADALPVRSHKPKQEMQRDLRAAPMPQPRDAVPLREPAAPPPPQHAPSQHHSSVRPRPIEDQRAQPSHHRHSHDAQASRPPSDVWAGAISRLQTQVSYNTSMHESHRRQVADIEQAVGRLQQEMGNVLAVISELRSELRARPGSAAEGAGRHDPGDLDVLATQIASITTKANEVDGLKMQLELMKNRVKRFEDHGPHSQPPAPPLPGGAPLSAHPMHGSPALSTLRPGPSPSSRPHDLPPNPPQHQHPLPPMRTASMASPRDDRRPTYNGPPPPLQAQGSGGFRPAPDSRPHSNEPGSNPAHHAGPNFRPNEPLPPPSALSGWRSAESFTSPAGGPASAPQQPHQGRPPHEAGPDASSTGWASVNQPPKRAFDDRPMYDGSPGSGSPKRPKLAPIMPRGNHGEEHHHPPPGGFPQGNPGIAPDNFRPRSRAPSDDMQAHAHGGRNETFRFVTATAPPPSSVPDGHDVWRSDVDRPEPGTGRGRGRGRGGRGRGRGGRGGRGGASAAGHAMATSHPPEPQEVQRAPEPPPPQIPQNGVYGAHHQSQSPRSELLRRAPGPLDREHFHGDMPATPMHNVNDQFAVQDPLSGSGKKSRTKPIRNAEGVLIRKDGRPDMRSVSSANNLRKVHAKKEAERAELDGRTPTSARSLVAGESNSDYGGTRAGTPMSGFAGDMHDDDEVDGANGHAAHPHHERQAYNSGRFIPRHGSEGPTHSDVDMRTDNGSERGRKLEREPRTTVEPTEEVPVARAAALYAAPQHETHSISGDNITATGPVVKQQEKADVVMEDAGKEDTGREEQTTPIGQDPTTIDVARKPSSANAAPAQDSTAQPATAAT